jgi:hypothetical protein
MREKHPKTLKIIHALLNTLSTQQDRPLYKECVCDFGGTAIKVLRKKQGEGNDGISHYKETQDQRNSYR